MMRQMTLCCPPTHREAAFFIIGVFGLGIVSDKGALVVVVIGCCCDEWVAKYQRYSTVAELHYGNNSTINP
jgi:hypothetical protein